MKHKGDRERQIDIKETDRDRHTRETGTSEIQRRERDRET